MKKAAFEAILQSLSREVPLHVIVLQRNNISVQTGKVIDQNVAVIAEASAKSCKLSTYNAHFQA